MKIYTKTGDKGTTSLFGGTRVSKDHLRIESYGTVDELNSYIGLIKDQAIDESTKNVLIKIQHDLFTLGSMLATQMNSKLPPMTHFILPGGHTTVSFCHIARCVCRRAERLSVSLHEQETINLDILTYLNRLSDYLFVLARKLSLDLRAQEVKWIPEKL